MKLFFVRHGESTYNAKRMHQHGQVPLSETGMKQARFVAKRFRTLPIEVIISSTYTRARQTAEVIAEETQREIEETPLLQELKRPSEIENLFYDDSKAVAIRKLLKDHEHDPLWHYADEENFFDLRNRATAFLSFLEKRKENNIAVVTHEHVIRTITGVMAFGDTFTQDISEYLEKTFTLTNTGITLCEKSREGRWHILTWNDFAHLGE